MVRPTVRVERKKRGKGVAGIASLLAGPSGVAVGLPAGEAEQEVINRAFFNEFGTRGGASGGGWGGPIPERPFLRNAMRNNRAKYKAYFKTASTAIVTAAAAGGDVALEKTKTLSRLGILAQGDIQAEISSLQSPPNSPVTIALKGAGKKPLIDRGEMFTKISFKILGQGKWSPIR